MNHMIKYSGINNDNNLRIYEDEAYCGIITGGENKIDTCDSYIGRVDCFECKELYNKKNGINR